MTDAENKRLAMPATSQREEDMAKRWPLWGLFAVLSVAALISSFGTAFQMLPLNPDMAEMALIYQGIVHRGWIR